MLNKRSILELAHLVLLSPRHNYRSKPKQLLKVFARSRAPGTCRIPDLEKPKRFLYLDGLRVMIHVDDHRPAHVHVIAADGEAMFVLNCPEDPPELLWGVVADGEPYSKGTGKATVSPLLKIERDSWRFLSRFSGRSKL